MKICSVEGCEEKHVGKGFCSKHWQQFKKNGGVKKRTNRDKNEIFIRDGVGIIVLYDRNNEVLAETLIDIEDIGRCKEIKWHVISMNPKHRSKYVATNRVQVKKNNLISGKLHCFLLGVKTDSKIHIDHKNGDTLDNRKNNLQVLTNGQNQIKKKMQKNNTSGYRGVVWYKKYKCWASRIRKDNKNYFVGYFETKEEAAMAYNERAKELFGELAVLNEIRKEG